MTAHVITDNSYYSDISEGNTSGKSVIHKFGRHLGVGTSFVPISVGGIYRTPQPAAATTLRIKAGNAADTSNGAGARTVYIEGLNASGVLTSETLTTNGASAGTASSNSYIRLFRAYVATSGTYATSAAGSHTASIVIENSAGTENWATIDATNFPKGQSEIGVYSVPLGYTAYIKNIDIHVETSKPANVLLFQRQNILETAAPYTAMRAVYNVIGTVDEVILPREMPLGPFPALTDLGFMGRVASTSASVSVFYDIILIAD